MPRDFIEQAFEEGAELRVCRRPITAPVRLDALAEMSKRFSETKMFQELMDFIIRGGQTDFLRHGRAQARTRFLIKGHHVAIAGQATC